MDAAVHLACGEVAALLPAREDWLSASERERFALLRSEPRKAQFLAVRWLARTLLAQVLGGRAQDWTLEAPHDAPPRVTGRDDLHLSISHSGHRTACALSSAPVGLDLEQPTRARDIAGLVALCCTPGEQALFAGLGDAAREALFYELWTVKEAWLKRRGEWIAPQRLQQLQVLPAVDGEVRCWRAGDWWVSVTAASAQWVTEQPRESRGWKVEDRRTVSWRT